MLLLLAAALLFMCLCPSSQKWLRDAKVKSTIEYNSHCN
jgi:hypothetical protein